MFTPVRTVSGHGAAVIAGYGAPIIVHNQQCLGTETDNTLTVQDTATLSSITSTNAYHVHQVRISDTTASTNTSTGALVVTGGVGVQGQLVSGLLAVGGCTVSNTGDFATTGTITGGIVSPGLVVTSTNDAASRTSGDFKANGGMAVGATLFCNDLNVGATSNLFTATHLHGDINAVSYTGTVTPTTVAITDTTDATSTTSAPFKTAGGLAAQLGLYAKTFNVSGTTVGASGDLVTGPLTTGKITFTKRISGVTNVLDGSTLPNPCTSIVSWQTSGGGINLPVPYSITNQVIQVSIFTGGPQFATFTASSGSPNLLGTGADGFGNANLTIPDIAYLATLVYDGTYWILK